jgi:hypothetical protein
MKKFYKLSTFLFLFISSMAFGQDETSHDNSEETQSEETEYRRVEPRSNWHHRRERKYTDGHQIKTIFRNNGSTGGYAAFSNKFTTINGDYANMVEFYGGWYLNHRILLGIGGAATTNYIPVAPMHSVNPNVRMSYEFVQAGLMTECVIASDQAVHVAFQLFAGGGATMQYERPEWYDDNWDDWDDINYYDHDEDFFYVLEPGVKVEVNVFRWLRFCPGVSYRIAYESKSRGLSDDALSGTSVNMTLKIGKF